MAKALCPFPMVIGPAASVLPASVAGLVASCHLATFGIVLDVKAGRDAVAAQALTSVRVATGAF